jgi:hypothetical protein
VINGVRTRDIQDHNLALYQLSYDHRVSGFSTRTDAPPQRCKRLAGRDVYQPVRALGFVVLILVGAGTAEAQVAAKPTPEDARRDYRHPPGGFGGSAVFGWADDGWVARLDYEVFPVMAPHGTFGPLAGFMSGLEYWRDGDDKGFSVPVLWTGGVRVKAMRALLGVGIHALTIDHVNDDTGVGVWGPIAMASVGVDVWGVRIGVDARATRRWQLGADDFTQLQLALRWLHVRHGRALHY